MDVDLNDPLDVLIASFGHQPVEGTCPQPTRYGAPCGRVAYCKDIRCPLSPEPPS